ncbi:MAG: hypothetical protein WEC59_11535 [Salibacteraceae bacterium]
MIKKTIYSVLAICLATLIGCNKDTDFAPPEIPVNDPNEVNPTGFVYASNESGKFEIWSYEAETSRQLTDDDEVDSWWPRYNRNSDKILFYQSKSSRDVNDFENADLMLMNSGGQSVSTLIKSGSYDWSKQGMADWSNDGEQIVLTAVESSIGSWQVYITENQGTNPKRVSQRDDVNYLDPIFSIDDGFIYCSTIPEGEDNKEDNYEIVRIDIVSGNEERLTFNDFSDHHPHISPDGEHIVFESLTEPDYLGIGKWSLRTLDLESRSERNLLNNDFINLFPRYSADGKTVYFNQLNIETFIMNSSKMNLESNEVMSIFDGSYNTMNIDPY